MKLPRRTLALIAMHGGAWLATTLGAGHLAAQTVPVTRAADDDQGPALQSASQGGWQPTRKTRSEASPYVQLTVNDSAPAPVQKAAAVEVERVKPLEQFMTPETGPQLAPPAKPRSASAKPVEQYQEPITTVHSTPDRRTTRATPANELPDNRGYTQQPSGQQNVRRAVAVDNASGSQRYTTRTANRADAYGFGSDRPGTVTRTSMTASAQSNQAQTRVPPRVADESPYASPKGRPSYRIAGREQLPTPAQPMEEIQGRSVMDGSGGEMRFEPAGPEVWDGDVSESYDGGCCGGGCSSCGSCSSGGCGRCNNCDCERCDDCWWVPPDWSDNIAAFAGVHAFKGSADQGLNGNFGFHEGLNAGLALCRDYCIGIQGGFSFTQSDFQGNAIIPDDRNQTFFTAGVFRRAPQCGGFQGGTVVDWMRDEYNVFMNLTQIRTEMSYVGGYGNEIGFWGTFHMKGDRDVLTNEEEFVTWKAIDQYNIFFRHQFCQGGEGRVWVGVTGDGDGLFGADMRIPIACSFAIEPSFNYLIPKSDSEGFAQEGFNVAINLVWYPHCRARAADCSPFRPLLPVADNGTFMIHADRSAIDQ